MQKSNPKRKHRPAQKQRKQPGKEAVMEPAPIFYNPAYLPSAKLRGKVAVITGGDSGIGRSVAVHFAAEGAEVAILYLNEVKDAEFTAAFIRDHYRAEALLIRCDIGNERKCSDAIGRVIKTFGRIDVVVNNAAVQYPQESLIDITAAQLEKTFRTNIYSHFYLTKAALPHLKEGSCIINSTSITAYRGSAHLIDYASTKGAIVAFTRSLSASLADRKIRVNAVAPGPVWTPLIPSSFDKDHVKTFGSDVPLGRAGEPFEIAPSYVFLASDDSRYMTGQVLHPNGGEIVNG